MASFGFGGMLGGGTTSKGSGVPLHTGWGNTAPPVAPPPAAPAPAPAPSAPTPAPQAPTRSGGQTSSSSSGATPYGAAGETAETLQNYGTGLLDPNSPESQRWMEELREQIGRSTDASQRAAGYMGAQSGFGAGASPEVLEMQQGLGVAGREAEGQAASDFILKAPTLGVDALGRALGPQTQMRGQDLNARLGMLGLGQSADQFNANMLWQQQQQDWQGGQNQADRELREFLMEFGDF